MEAGVCDNEQMMYSQIRKAACEPSKNTIFTPDGNVPTTYQGWKEQLLCMDYNFHLKRAENPVVGQASDSKTQAPKVTMPQKGGQALTGMPEKKTGTGITYGGQGTPIDIDRKQVEGQCF